MDHLTICLNLDILAPTQFQEFDFLSFANFNGVDIAAGPDGIFQIDTGSLDDTSIIEAWFETVTSSLGSDKVRHILSAMLKYECNGDLKLTVTVDEGVTKTFQLPETITSMLQRGTNIYMTLSPCGTYYTFKFENIAGCDFAIDSMFVLLEIMSRYHHSNAVHGVAQIVGTSSDFVVLGTGS